MNNIRRETEQRWYKNSSAPMPARLRSKFVTPLYKEIIIHSLVVTGDLRPLTLPI